MPSWIASGIDDRPLPGPGHRRADGGHVRDDGLRGAGPARDRAPRHPPERRRGPRRPRCRPAAADHRAGAGGRDARWPCSSIIATATGWTTRSAWTATPATSSLSSPRRPGLALLQGRAWISAEDFGLVRMDAEQTGLRGPIVSSRQRDEYRALDFDGERAWVLRRSETHQSYEGPGHRTPIHRVMTLDAFEANPPDFAARREAAHRSSSVLLALDRRGVPLPAARRAAASRRDGPGTRKARRPPCARSPAASTRIWTAAAGLLVDPNIDDPLPFAGLGYLDLDFLGTGSPAERVRRRPLPPARVVGARPAAAPSSRSAASPRWSSTTTASFRDGVERYDENLRQRPASAALDVIRPFGGGWRVRASYELTHPGLGRGPDTAPAFRTPANPTVHAARLGLEGEVARWTLSAWASAALRDTWTDWGYPGNPDSRSGRARLRARRRGRRAVVRPRPAARRPGGRRGDGRPRARPLQPVHLRRPGEPPARLALGRGALRSRGGPAQRALRHRHPRRARRRVPRPRGRPRSRPRGRAIARSPASAPPAELRLPWSTLLSVEWGYGPEARDREGQRGAHVVRITAYKVL